MIDGGPSSTIEHHAGDCSPDESMRQHEPLLQHSTSESDLPHAEYDAVQQPINGTAVFHENTEPALRGQTLDLHYELRNAVSGQPEDTLQRITTADTWATYVSTHDQSAPLDGLEVQAARPPAQEIVIPPVCRYRCLEPLLPYIQDIVPPWLACDLLDNYFNEPGASFFHCASPYVLTPIVRKASLLRADGCRPTTLALLSTMLWCSLQATDDNVIHTPGSRSQMSTALYEVSVALVADRDPDHWRRTHGKSKAVLQRRQFADQMSAGPMREFEALRTSTQEPSRSSFGSQTDRATIDDVLTFAMLSIGVSGSDFKLDSLKWWSKAVRLAFRLGLNKEDESLDGRRSSHCTPWSSHQDTRPLPPVQSLEVKEERRRVFWLLYALDRHLALSFNSTLSIADSACLVLSMSENIVRQPHGDRHADHRW